MKELKSSELMLNNYILRNGELFQVDEDTYSDMAYFTREDTFEPIELTEKWLWMMGFEQTDNEILFKYEIGNNLALYADFNEKIFGINMEWKEHIYISLRNASFYVHATQNLIHSLTGEELTIKN